MTWNWFRLWFWMRYLNAVCSIVLLRWERGDTPTRDRRAFTGNGGLVGGNRLASRNRFSGRNGFDRFRLGVSERNLPLALFLPGWLANFLPRCALAAFNRLGYHARRVGYRPPGPCSRWGFPSHRRRSRFLSNRRRRDVTTWWWGHVTSPALFIIGHTHGPSFSDEFRLGFLQFGELALVWLAGFMLRGLTQLVSPRNGWFVFRFDFLLLLQVLKVPRPILG